MATVRANPVKTLRLTGCKVRVSHLRRYKCPVVGGYDIKLSPHGVYPEYKTLQCKPTMLTTGGVTVVKVTLPTGKVLEGEAVCSDKESYCKRTGVAYCLDRLRPV